MRKLLIQCVGVILSLCFVSAWAWVPVGPYVKLSGGMGFVKGPSTNWSRPLRIHFSDAPFSGQYYFVNDSRKLETAPLIGASGGYAFYWPPYLRFQVGVGLYRIGDYTVKGAATDSFLLLSKNEWPIPSYRFKINSTQAMAEALVMLEPTNISDTAVFSWSRFSPYFSVGIGAAKNTIHSFSFTRNKNTPHSFNGFSHHSHTALAYQGGLGLNYQITPKVGISLGYRYVFLGKAEFGNPTGQATVNHLYTRSIAVHEALMQLMYLF